MYVCVSLMYVCVCISDMCVCVSLMYVCVFSGGVCVSDVCGISDMCVCVSLMYVCVSLICVCVSGVVCVQESYPLRSLMSSQLCVRGQQESLEGQAVVVKRGGCSSLRRLWWLRIWERLLLIASVDNLVTPSVNGSELSKVKIPVALVRHRDVLDALQVRTIQSERFIYKHTAE